MKTKSSFIALALLALSTLNSQLSTAHAQGTAFSYQGRLVSGGAPAGGSDDLTFTLYDSDQPGGNLIAGPLTNSATAVSNGLFTTTIDFGAGVFTGTNYWLEIAVETNGGSGFTTLAPRQELTPVPYAIFANTASNVLGTVPPAGLSGNYDSALTLDNPGNSISGTFTGDGTGVANVDAATLDGLTSAAFWSTAGNAGANPTNGAFLGTTDNLPLELRVGGSRALRLEYARNPSFNSIVPNLIGGYSGNVVSNGFIGATIVGGGDIGVQNSVGNNYATVLGGLSNTARGSISVAMGNGCTASGDEATAMGHGTISSGVISTSMGDATTANGLGSVAMGYKSYANGETSLAAGNYANAGYDGSFVWADDSVNSYFSDATANQFLIRAAGGVGIGTSQAPPGGLRVDSGGLAVTGASSPNYGNGRGRLHRKVCEAGAVYAFNYATDLPTSLLLNSPGGNVGIGTTTPGALLQVGNATCNGTMWVNASDRNTKEDFAAINPRAVLEKVSALLITEWKYKVEQDGTKHLGPMAQDFHAAFGLNGADDKHIATVDEEGVALAAIQGLNEKVEVRSQNSESRIQKLEAENAELRQRLAALEKISLNQKSN